MLSWVKRKLHGKDSPLIPRFALHARNLSLQDLDGAPLSFEAPYAKDMEVMMKLLNRYDV
jgi:23S rRNA pseudouridine955/2504/2580 synthase